MRYFQVSELLGPHLVAIISALVLLGMLILVARLPKGPQSNSTRNRRSS